MTHDGGQPGVVLPGLLTRKGMERRKLLHVSIDGLLTAEVDGVAVSLRCCELSLRDMRVWAPDAWTSSTELSLRTLEVGRECFELAGFATLIKTEEGANEDGQVLTTIEYVDFDVVAESCMQTVFSHVAERLYRDERLVMRFNWAFRDVAQLVAVCKTLLALVDLSGAWTDAGPSESARIFLAAKGQGLPPAHRAMLEIVWKLWCGSLDLPVPTAELSPSVRAAFIALKKAMARGPTGIDEWLRVEQRSQITSSDVATDDRR